jgi:membrane-bound ClpP family serine protease
MIWLLIIGLLALGLALIVLEFVFIPGTTLVGFIGLACAGYGIYLGYTHFGPATGTLILAGFGGASLAILYFSLKSGIWERFSLQTSIKSKVNEDEWMPLQGDIGRAVANLRPMGTVDFDGEMREATSLGGLVEAGRKVRVVKLEGHRIWVEEVKEAD